MKKVTDFNVETGEKLEREMTVQELKQLENDISAAQLQKENYEKQITEKAALLAKLGITDNEAKLLLS